MKAYLTSIGEKTTGIVAWQLKRLGFEVVLLDGKEPWVDKYRKFIELARNANEPCLRIDADVIPNKGLVELWDFVVNYDGGANDIWLAHGELFCFYKNDIIKSGPVIYKPEALQEISKNFGQLNAKRPESSGARLASVNPHFKHYEKIVGSHGFFQDKEHFNRAIKHRSERGQMENFDLELAEELLYI